MKICVLMGSPRKRDSYDICRLIEKSFATVEAEFEYLFLGKYEIQNCRGCDQCFLKTEESCPCRDDIPMIKEKMLGADGIIFASPVYACQVTGLMKTAFDRLSYLFHRQEFVGKPALIVVTTGGGGQRPTGKYLAMTACGWGCRLVGKISVVSPRFLDRREYDEKYRQKAMLSITKAAAAFEQAMLSQSKPSPSWYDIFLFQCLRSKTFVSKADYDFWKKRGWLDSNYFYECKLSPGKLLFGRLMKAYVNLAARKMLPSQKGS